MSYMPYCTHSKPSPHPSVCHSITTICSAHSAQRPKYGSPRKEVLYEDAPTNNPSHQSCYVGLVAPTRTMPPIQKYRILPAQRGQRLVYHPLHAARQRHHPHTTPMAICRLHPMGDHTACQVVYHHAIRAASLSYDTLRRAIHGTMATSQCAHPYHQKMARFVSSFRTND